MKISPDEICDHIFKLARKGLTPSQIGVVLRDSHGVAQVKSVTGNKVLRILKTNGEATLVGRGGRKIVCGREGRARWTEHEQEQANETHRVPASPSRRDGGARFGGGNRCPNGQPGDAAHITQLKSELRD